MACDKISVSTIVSILIFDELTGEQFLLVYDFVLNFRYNRKICRITGDVEEDIFQIIEKEE